MIGDTPLGHVHCHRCGREMRPMSSCGMCGEPWLTIATAPSPSGVGVEVSRVVPAAPAATPIVSAPSLPAQEVVVAAARLRTPHRSPTGFGRPAPSIHRGRSAPAAAPPRPAEPWTTPPAWIDPPAVAEAAPVAPRATIRRAFKPIDIWKRYLPPVRLVWLFLGVLVWYAGGFVSAAGSFLVLAIPAIGIITDLGFQRVRFPKLRFPDAALATSLFLVLIVWPSALDLALVSIVVASVGLRHVLRRGGHPLLNPVASGLAIGAILFALPNSWHVGIGWDHELLIALFGAVLVARAPHTWRLPVFYFATYLPLSVALTFALGGGARWLEMLTLGALAPGSIFYGMFMVTEPRTAPSHRGAMVAFAILVGIASACLPVLFTEVPSISALGVVAPFVALFVGNVFTLVLPSARGLRHPTASGATSAAGRRLPGLSR